MYRNGTGTAPRPHCDGTVTCPPRHRHGAAIAPARHRTFCANGPFAVRGLTILPHRHWHGTRPQCDGSVTGPPRDRNGTAALMVAIQAIGRMMATIAMIAMISIYPSSRQPGPQPLPPSAGGAHVVSYHTVGKELIEFLRNLRNPVYILVR